jgi:hypothetical protein
MAKIQEMQGKNTISATTISSWSRQQKLAMVAGFALLGLLLFVGACSKQSSRPAQSLSLNQGPTTPQTTSVTSTQPAGAPATPATAAKKVHKKRPATVTYSDPNSGVSFHYPRKFELATGDKAEAQFAEMGPAPMNFVQPGGVAIATVNMPENSYPGTDFTTGFFNVNVNRSLSEQECSQFAFVDTRDADGEPLEADKVKIGSMDLEKTSEFSADAMKQAEAQYFHQYENGACYEFVLGVGTAGYGTKDDIKPVDRDQVFSRLEKILETVKIQTVEQPKVAATQTVESGDQSAK